MRPGLTGLAQVRGWRGETETEEKLLRRVEADLEYIETWSLGLDFVDPGAHRGLGACHAQRLLSGGAPNTVRTIMLQTRLDT